MPGHPYLRHLLRTSWQTPRLGAFRLLLPRILNRFHTRLHSKPVRRLERLSVYTSLNQAVVFSQLRATYFVLRRKAVIVWTTPNEKRLAPKVQLSEDLRDCAPPPRAKVRAAISRCRTTPRLSIELRRLPPPHQTPPAMPPTLTLPLRPTQPDRAVPQSLQGAITSAPATCSAAA